jgi:hypothetical protein
MKEKYSKCSKVRELIGKYLERSTRDNMRIVTSSGQRKLPI